MTPRERSLLDAIERLTNQGVPPTYSKLRDELGLAAKSGVHRMVASLIGQGRLRRSWKKHQSLEIVRPSGPTDVEIGLMSDDDIRRLYERVGRELASRGQGLAA